MFCPLNLSTKCGSGKSGVRIYDDVLIYSFRFSLSPHHKNNILRTGSQKYIIHVKTAPIDDTMFGMATQWIFVITICTLLMMLACGVCLSICICRRNSNRNMAHKSQMAMTTSDVNGQKHLNFYRPAVLGEFPQEKDECELN